MIYIYISICSTITLHVIGSCCFPSAHFLLYLNIFYWWSILQMLNENPQIDHETQIDVKWDDGLWWAYYRISLTSLMNFYYNEFKCQVFFFMTYDNKGRKWQNKHLNFNIKM